MQQFNHYSNRFSIILLILKLAKIIQNSYFLCKFYFTHWNRLKQWNNQIVLQLSQLQKKLITIVPYGGATFVIQPCMSLKDPEKSLDLTLGNFILKNFFKRPYCLTFKIAPTWKLICKAMLMLIKTCNQRYQFFSTCMVSINFFCFNVHGFADTTSCS